jgi:hypothetical protein
MIKVTCQVDSYDDPVKPSIRVHNHWNRNEMVILEVEDKLVPYPRFVSDADSVRYQWILQR